MELWFPSGFQAGSQQKFKLLNQITVPKKPNKPAIPGSWLALVEKNITPRIGVHCYFSLFLPPKIKQPHAHIYRCVRTGCIEDKERDGLKEHDLKG